ncbi:MAG TPA: hypothetical protein DDY68_01195 [Porphyromonadaceae bacterium]|nr:hypothetical protein [Porphyromonadaceae bacterium]
MENFVAIDFETANQNRSSVCSVGIVVVKNCKIVNKFYRLIHPIPDFYSYWNTQVHGITSSDTRESPSFPMVWSEIRTIIQDLPLVAHNSSFDEGCLKSVFRAYDMTYPNYEFHCTLKASKKILEGKLCNYQLQTVAKYYGFDLEKHHHALADAEACAIIATKIL